MLGSRPFYQANLRSNILHSLVFTGFLVILSGCAHKDTPSTTAENSANISNAKVQKFDHQRFMNTSEFKLADSNVSNRTPRVKASLSSGQKGSKATFSGDIPPFVLIESDEVNQWRFATVKVPAGGRTLFAAPMRLPISTTVPIGEYIVVRPISQIQDDPAATKPQAYLFEVVASATAEKQRGNLLTLQNGISPAKPDDWVIPIDYLDQTDAGISSVIGNIGEISVLDIVPGRSFGSNGHIAIINAGVQQGLSVDDAFAAHAGRIEGNHGRAIRDGRDIQPEGNAKLVIIQSSYNYALAEIQQSSQPIVAGDILLPISQK